MKSYSQNQEDIFILNHFSNYIGRSGRLLSIGENDGETFSNAKLLIEHGWHAELIEPSTAALKCAMLHRDNANVRVHEIAITETDGEFVFYESGNHVPHGTDSCLVSSIDKGEIERWQQSGVEFKETKIQGVTFETLTKHITPHFDFISIDAEGYDWQILKQIDLDAVRCSVLCIEWNSKPELLKLFTDYCKGFKIGLINNENIIFVR